MSDLSIAFLHLLPIISPPQPSVFILPWVQVSGFHLLLKLILAPRQSSALGYSGKSPLSQDIMLPGPCPGSNTCSPYTRSLTLSSEWDCTLVPSTKKLPCHVSLSKFHSENLAQISFAPVSLSVPRFSSLLWMLWALTSGLILLILLLLFRIYLSTKTMNWLAICSWSYSFPLKSISVWRAETRNHIMHLHILYSLYHRVVHTTGRYLWVSDSLNPPQSQWSWEDRSAQPEYRALKSLVFSCFILQTKSPRLLKSMALVYSINSISWI